MDTAQRALNWATQVGAWPVTYGPHRPLCHQCGGSKPRVRHTYQLEHYPALHRTTICRLLQCRVCGLEWAHAYTP